MTVDDSVALIAGLPRYRNTLHGVLRGQPVLVGPSRKGFLEKTTARSVPANTATATVSALCMANGAGNLRHAQRACGARRGAGSSGCVYQVVVISFVLGVDGRNWC